MKNKFKAQIIESNEVTLKGKEIACNIINDDMTKPPKWFQHWSETVYQKQPPHWFQNWNANIFEPFKQNVETHMKEVNNRLDRIETHMQEIDSFIGFTNSKVQSN